MTKNIKFVIIRFVFQAQNAPKSVSAPDPAGGAYDAPPDPLVGWGGEYPLPIPLPARRLRQFGVSNSASTAPRFSGPLNTQNPGYASGLVPGNMFFKFEVRIFSSIGIISTFSKNIGSRLPWPRPFFEKF